MARETFVRAKLRNGRTRVSKSPGRELAAELVISPHRSIS